MSMIFSDFGNQFLQQETGILALMDEAGKTSTNEKYCMLGLGDPAIIEEAQLLFKAQLQKIIANDEDLKRILSQYANPQGELKFIARLCQYLQNKLAWKVQEDNVIITHGSQNGLYMLFNLLAGKRKDCQHSGRILLPINPEYIGYFNCGIEGNIFCSVPPKIISITEHEFRYEPDLDKIAQQTNIAAICLSRPTNPTGYVASYNTINSLLRLADYWQIPLIIDQAYGAPFPNINFTDTRIDYKENLILSFSASKLGLPAVRTGIILAPSNIVSVLKNMNAVTALAPSSLGVIMIEKLLESDQMDYLCNNIIKPFYKNKKDKILELLDYYFQGIPWKVHQIQGGIFAWIWFDHLPITSQALQQQLKEEYVVIVSGHYFFNVDKTWKHQYECIRINFSQTDTEIESGLKRIAQCVKKTYQTIK